MVLTLRERNILRGFKDIIWLRNLAEGREVQIQPGTGMREFRNPLSRQYIKMIKSSNQGIS